MVLSYASSSMIYSFVHWRHEMHNHHMSLFLVSLFCFVILFIYCLFYFALLFLSCAKIKRFSSVGADLRTRASNRLAMAKASIHFSCVFRSLSHHHLHMVVLCILAKRTPYSYVQSIPNVSDNDSNRGTASTHINMP